jgi:hypothetical protein
MRCLDVTLRWEEDVVDVRRLIDETTLTIGTSEEDDLFVPLPDERFRLLERPHDAAPWTLRLAADMEGWLVLDDGDIPLRELARPGADGALSLPLEAGARAQIAFGSFRVELAHAQQHAAALVPFSIDERLTNTSLVAGTAFAALVAAFLLAPPKLEDPDAALTRGVQQFTRVLHSATVRLQPKAKVADAQTTETARAASGRDGKKHKRRGGSGDVARELMSALGGLGNSGGGGTDLLAALGQISGSRSAGVGGGLGLRGEVGTGSGHDTYLLGGVTRAAGSLSGDCRGADECDDSGLDKKVERAPSTVTWHKPTITGGLDRELIRRVVRTQSAAVRFCFERALQSTPGLGGKVTVRWVIGRDGGARQPTVIRDDVGAGVARCVARRVGSWRFPSSDGVTVVNYPFVFRAR